MAFVSVIVPSPKVFVRTQLFAVGRAESDAEMRANLRLIAAVLMAHWSDINPDLSGVRGNIFDVVTSEVFYQRGFAKTVDEHGDRLWLCSYVGYEKITSEWAKKKHPQCKGYICMRIFNQDAKQTELDAHTVQFYF